jgi:hypothetical protein
MKLFRSKKEPPPQINRAESLACIPVILPAITWEKQDSGEILIEYPLVLKPLLKAIFMRFNKEKTEKLTKKLQLDGLGSQVWSCIDGQRNVQEIIAEFATASTITNQEAELSVTTFIRELGRRGLIILR